MKVRVYEDTSKAPDDPERFKRFETEDEAQAWLAVHDPEGVAFAEDTDLNNPQQPPPIAPPGRSRLR
ncbi:hypothetical protein IC762_17920 [Bradyrhizobium genosp. L]|uniref:hypothetical protein n=1 Tax=Bradyrhizobium genosp. L TaxID=83637 RepID=UPI0018A295F9|nr:hypothetical protein [Bradyrhizobium genosp. L]QPF81701.1 hypothetical protein IC762_17920 [Bradyrhizobium genosp. L]